MTVPNLVNASATTITNQTISSEGAVITSYSAPNLTFSQPTTYRSGQLINSKLYTLGTDYVPSVSLGVQGSAGAYAFNPAAFFFSLSYTPLASNSVIDIHGAWNAARSDLTSNKAGILVLGYSGNVAGVSLPMTGSIGCNSGGVSNATVQEYITVENFYTYTNSQTADLTFYFCATYFGALTTQRIMSSSSTVTALAGYAASTVLIEEYFI